MKDEFLSEEDLDLANLSDEELERATGISGCTRRRPRTTSTPAATRTACSSRNPAREPTPLTARERRILDFLLDGSGEVLEALRGQIAEARVIRRLHSGVGFFVDLVPGGGVRPLPGRPSFWLDDVFARVQELEPGMGLQLKVKDGIATMLEGWITDKTLPVDWHLLELSYSALGPSAPIVRPKLASRTHPAPGFNVAREKPPPYPRG
ncbi:MAG: hypothetical protein IPJ19_04260 [Planctomycetes bacterium]|nr:hypothetical protein [Planctomycetota bacterium]